jgi:hypothetical protein
MEKADLLARAREAEQEAQLHTSALMRSTLEQLANIFDRMAALEPEPLPENDEPEGAAAHFKKNTPPSEVDEILSGQVN